MTKVTSPVQVAPSIAPPFSLHLRAERASKVDAAAYGEHVARTTAPVDTPQRYAELAFAKTMIEAAMKEIKGETLRQVQSGNTANDYGVKMTVATGRSSFDFSKEEKYVKAVERLDKAKKNLEQVKTRLATAGKGKAKIAAPTLRATIS